MTICPWRSWETTNDSGVGESVGSGPSYDNVSVPFRSGVSSHNHQRDSAFISGESFLGHSTATVTWLRPAGRLLLGPPSRSQAQPSTRQETPQGRRHKGPPQKVSRRKAEKVHPACLRRTLAKPLDSRNAESASIRLRLTRPVEELSDHPPGACDQSGQPVSHEGPSSTCLISAIRLFFEIAQQAAATRRGRGGNGLADSAQ